MTTGESTTATGAPAKIRTAEIISIVSGKGGVGKTTLTSNLGVILASEFRKKVLLIDGNISTANLGIHLGFIKCPVSVQDVIDKTIKTYQAIYVHRSGLHIIPASLSMEHEQHDYAARTLAGRINRIVSDVRHDYDLIIIDGAAGISGEAKAAIAASDTCVVITVPEIPTVTAAIKVVETSRELEVPVLGIVLNRVRGGKIEVPSAEVEHLCGAKIIVTIPEDEAVRESTSHREPVSMLKPSAPSVREIRRFAEILVKGLPAKDAHPKEPVHSEPAPAQAPKLTEKKEDGKDREKKEEELKKREEAEKKKREKEERDAAEKEAKKKKAAEQEQEEKKRRKEAEEAAEEKRRKEKQGKKPGLFRRVFSFLPFVGGKPPANPPAPAEEKNRKNAAQQTQHSKK